MTRRPPLVLCSGSLGQAPFEDKIRAAALAGFEMISVYGAEYRHSVERGVDVDALVQDSGLRVAEVDGVAISLSASHATEQYDEALRIASKVGARSITVVEAGDYNPQDQHQVGAAALRFGTWCDRAADLGVLIHIEPFAWSSLARSIDAWAIVDRADRANGGVLLDLWHHVRGPDRGRLDPGIPLAAILGIQISDTVAEPWENVRDESMHQRLLPGDGASGLAARLGELAARGPLPPIGVEVFGDTLGELSSDDAARLCRDKAIKVLDAAGL